MKQWFFPTVAVAFLAAGCASQPGQAPQSSHQQAQTQPAQTQPAQTQPAQTQPAQTQPVKLTTEQELAKYCRVCVVDKGEKIEEFFPSRLDTPKDGQTYKFCSDDCKKKFDANSKQYALK
jgi:hypothetical protein